MLALRQDRPVPNILFAVPPGGTSRLGRWDVKSLVWVVRLTSVPSQLYMPTRPSKKDKQVALSRSSKHLGIPKASGIPSDNGRSSITGKLLNSCIDWKGEKAKALAHMPDMRWPADWGMLAIGNKEPYPFPFPFLTSNIQSCLCVTKTFNMCQEGCYLVWPRQGSNKEEWCHQRL